MLDDIIELVLELVIELMVDIFPRIRIPRAVKRFLSVLLLISVYGGSGLLIGFGIVNAANWMIALGTVIIVVSSLWLGFQLRRFRC